MGEVIKLFNLPRHKDIKIYLHDETIVIFDHVDGLYSYCWLENDKNKIVHLECTLEIEPYKDGYRIKGV